MFLSLFSKIINVYIQSEVNNKFTNLVEEQDEIESEGNKQSKEPKIVKVTRKVVLGENKEEGFSKAQDTVQCMFSLH